VLPSNIQMINPSQAIVELDDEREEDHDDEEEYDDFDLEGQPAQQGEPSPVVDDLTEDGDGVSMASLL
jgi:hypothetical protein